MVSTALWKRPTLVVHGLACCQTVAPADRLQCWLLYALHVQGKQRVQSGLVRSAAAHLKTVQVPLWGWSLMHVCQPTCR